MKKHNRIVPVIGCLLLLAGIWPILSFVNRIHPFILGLPFFVFYMIALNLLVAVYVFIVFRTVE